MSNVEFEIMTLLLCSLSSRVSSQLPHRPRPSSSDLGSLGCCARTTLFCKNILPPPQPVVSINNKSNKINLSISLKMIPNNIIFCLALVPPSEMLRVGHRVTMHCGVVHSVSDQQQQQQEQQWHPFHSSCVDAVIIYGMDAEWLGDHYFNQ